MNTIFILLGAVLALVFFLNIKPAAEVLCRIVCGFALLLCYNMVAAPLSWVTIGINLISSLIVGIFGFPGGVMLILASLFL